MDSVTAAGSANLTFDALASSGLLAVTYADGVATTYQAALFGPPHQAEVSVSMGSANAVAQGDAPFASSSINPTTATTPGPAVYENSFGMAISTPNIGYSMGWSLSVTSTANPWALTGL